MAFNGSGVFNRLYNWVTDRNNAVKIRADRMDAEMDGIATGLSNCITKDGQTTITANIPFNDKRITGLADASAATDAMNRQSCDARYLELDGTGTMTGVILAANGSVSAPAYTFGSDTNSGLYRIGADNLGVAVNGAKVVDVATTGVAITGTASVSGTLTASSTLELGNASDTTLSRASAGRMAVEGVNVVTISSTDTLTNKTINLTSNTLTATSAQIAAAVTDETGTGSLVFSASPALTGSPTAPTQSAATENTTIATTAFCWGTLGAPDGTKIVFNQTAAPTGWTKDVTHDNKALRVVSGTASSGGSTAFTSVFAARTISASNLPDHSITITDAGHDHDFTYSTDQFAAGSNAGVTNIQAGTALAVDRTVSSDTTGITAAFGSTARGGAQTTIDFAVQYVDVTICTKS